MNSDLWQKSEYKFERLFLYAFPKLEGGIPSRSRALPTQTHKLRQSRNGIGYTESIKNEKG